MQASLALERAARELYDQEWQRHRRTPRAAAGPDPSLQVCPVGWLLHDLLRLIAEGHDRPVRELEPMIRQLIVEKNFCDETGDVCLDDQQRRSIDDYVDVLVRVLERVREQAVASGAWSSLPASAPMCG